MLLLANNKEQSRHSLYHLWSLYQKSDGNVMALADPAHFYERASRSTGAQAVLRLRIGRVRRRCGEWCGWIFDISQPLLSLWHLVCNRTELSKCRPHLFQQLHRWHRPALSVLAMLLHVSNNTFHMNALVALSLARDLKTRIHNNEKLDTTHRWSQTQNGVYLIAFNPCFFFVV